ncbi:MAG TPA: MFS transporter [Ktedonobacteraceae bacterium]|nr:MFS transporter [Ktedonobacteraceae bacterium]
MGRNRLPWPTKTPYYGWILMVVLGITTIISYGTTQYLFGVLVVPISTTFQWDRASISGAYTLGLIVAGVIGVPIGPLLDRSGARLLMSCGSALAGLALIGLSQMHTLWQFYVLWSGGLGLAMALTLYPVTFTIVANWFVRKRGTALAVLTLIGGLSSPICIPLSGVLIAQIGWRTTLVVLGCSQLLLALPLHFFVLKRHPEDLGLSPDGEPTPEVKTSQSLTGFSLSMALHSPTFWMLTTSLSLVMLGSTVVFVHQVAYLIGRGYNPVLVATLSGMLGLVSLPGRYVFNTLSTRVSAQMLLGLSIVTQAIGMAVLVLAPSLPWLILYVIIYGTAYGAFSPLRASVMADHFGRRAYGSITAVQGVPGALCAGLGPLVAGWIYDTSHHYELAFWLCAGAFLLGALGIFVTSQPRNEHESTTVEKVELVQEVVGSKMEG